MAFKVAIPSYKRSDVIMAKTLHTLRRGGVAISDIYIFVVDDEQEAYKGACPDYQIIVGLKGVIEQRNFIQEFFDKDTYIVMMDDDITEIYKPLSEKTKEEILDLPSLFGNMMDRMQMEGVSICGTYPVDNIMFSFNNKEVTMDFRYIIGVFYIIKNTRDPDIIVSPTASASHEDKIRTLYYYKKEGKTLRFNHICFKTKYFAKGGQCALDSDRLTKHSQQSEELCKKYPEYFRIKRGKKIVDIAFKKAPGYSSSSVSIPS